MAVKTSELQKVTNLEAGGSSFLVDTPQGTLLLPTSHFPQNFTADKLLMPDKTTTIEQKIRWHSNPNLVDNCDFSVWQRYPSGVYEGVPDNIYIADRFKIVSSNGSIKNTFKRLDGGGILNETGVNCVIKYQRENASVLNGKKCTLSYLHKDASGSITLVTCTKTPSGLTSSTDLLGYFVPGGQLWIRSKCSLLQIKLEIGSTQTLAHKEGDTWVLNDPPPNPALELLKCQRYYQLFETEALRPTNAKDFRPPMRINPVLGTIERDGKTYYTADANL